MTKPAFWYRKLYLVVIAVVLICMAVVGTSAWSSRAWPGQNKGLNITNKTQALQVVNAEAVGGNLHLSLKNSFGKNITAYTVSVGNVKMEEDFIYSDRAITPGETYKTEIPIPASGPDTAILAVVFEDKSIDGDTEVAASIKDRRLGEKLQLTRILRLMRDSANLDELKSKISALSETVETGLSPAVKSGLHNGKEDVLRAIQKLERRPPVAGAPEVQDSLSKLEEHYRRMADKL